MPSNPESINIANKVLKKLFNNHVPLNTHDHITWSLNNQYSIGETVDERGSSYTLWQFPIKEDLIKKCLNYPLYFSFTISVKSNDQIDKVNIKIFKEDTSKLKKSSFIPTELLLRVEWDNESPKEEVNSKHAQPHWHIHSYKIIDFFEGMHPDNRKTFLELIDANVNNKVSSILDEKEEQINDPQVQVGAETIVDKDIPSFRFHLAMLAEWDKPGFSKHDKILTDDILKLWLPSCLAYIKEQLEYVLKKMG
jgi:hypothetical protein